MTVSCREHDAHRAGCLECRRLSREDARRRRRLRRENRTIPPMPIAAIRAHLDVLRRCGMTPAVVAAASGLPPSSVHGLMRPTRRWVSAEVAAAILSIPPSPRWDRLGSVNALGTARRLQALCARGFSIRRQAAMLGMPENSVWSLAHLRRLWIRPATAARIRRHYERYECEEAPRSRSATLTAGVAQRHGWAPPERWRLGSIDDPYSLPLPDGHRSIDPELILQYAHSLAHGSRPAGLDQLRVGEQKLLLERLHHRYRWGYKKISDATGLSTHRVKTLLVEPLHAQNRTPAMPTLVLVTGSRYATAPAHLHVIHRALVEAVNGLPGPHELIHGATPGVDTLAGMSATLLCWGVTPMPADWSGPCTQQCRHGGRRIRRGVEYCPVAGNRRNQQMVDEVVRRRDADHVTVKVLAFPLDTGSTGTEDCIRRARRAGFRPEVTPLHLPGR